MRKRLSILAMVLILVPSVLLSVQAKTPMKALISGVPRYFQIDMQINGSCWFPSGCGPVAGAAVCAWWDKRGFPNLIDDQERMQNGLPQQAIEDLGAAHYMNRDTTCVDSWVLPGRFATGLEDYMNDHLGPRAAVARFEVTRYRITDSGYEVPETGESGSYEELFSIVREEIWNGRPMVYLFRWDGHKNNDDTLKVADHYAVVVGYDGSEGSRRLVIQGNQTTLTYDAVTGYQNVYIGSAHYLRLGDHTKGSAAVKYHLYAIRPVPASSVEIGLGADPLLLFPPIVANTRYHINGNDGVSTSWFEPKLEQTDVFAEDLWHDHDDWGKTDELILQDGICFVAGWRTETAASAEADSDGDGIPDAHDKPDFQPVYVRAEVDGVSETQVKLTLFVELRNLGQAREPFYGGVEVRWEYVEETGTPARRVTTPTQTSGPQVAANPLFPGTSTEKVTSTGQSTLYLEHSWMLDRDDWEATGGFSHPFAFNVEVDPDDDVSELIESNNVCEISIGSWSAEAGFLGGASRIREVRLSSQVKDRVGSARLRIWGPHPVDPSVLGDPSFTALDVGRQDLGRLASMLSDVDREDLFVVIVAGTGIALVDVAL